MMMSAFDNCTYSAFCTHTTLTLYMIKLVLTSEEKNVNICPQERLEHSEITHQCIHSKYTRKQGISKDGIDLVFLE